MLQQRPPRGEQVDAPRRAGEQRRAELPLQLADAARERRLRDPQPARGAGDVLFFRDGDEIAKLVEAHPVTATP